MATATKQLEAISQEISQTFSGNSRISVSPLAGNPPEKYEITYRITGVFKDDSGEIREKDRHTITISIPFGFPHFPPNCKPSSPIFHPDFDPAAICIGDFWEKDRSISDLISHIGQMISGEVYSTSNAFNEEAAKWYKNNDSRLPFEPVEITFDDELPAGEPAELSQPDDDDVTNLLDDIEDDDSIFDDIQLETLPEEEINGSEDEKVLEFDAQEMADGVDTLDDSFLDTDYDYLGTENGSEADAPAAPPSLEPGLITSDTEVDVDRFKLMAKQKRFHELDKELRSLPARHSFDGRDTLSTQAAAALKEAREVYDQGTDFEHRGNPGKALESFKQTEDIVSDYPGLKEDIERTTQAKELLGDWTDAPERDMGRMTSSFESEEPVEEELPPLDSPEPEKKQSESRTFFEGAARQTSRLIPIVAGIIVLLVLSAAGGYYYLNTAQLDKAVKTFAMCRTVLEQNRFAETERQCEAALDQAKQVQFFKGGARDSLMEEIKGVLNSQLLIEGLAGNRLLDGKYLPQEVVKTILAFKHFMAAGDEHFSTEAWQQASTSYKQALNVAAQQEGVDKELIFTVTENMKIAEFEVLMRSGTEFIEREKWVLATQDLNKALASVKTLNIENKAETIDAITAKLAEIALATSKEEGDDAFAAGNWKEALDHYTNALNAVKKSYSPGNQTVEDLNQLIVKAELYDTINSGKEAFTQSDWDQAIIKYEKAIEILETNQEVLKQTNTEENRKKLARVMLQASIIRDTQDAARYLKEKQYLTAMEQLQSIIDTISESDFSKSAEFKAVVKETKEAIVQAETDMLLADKIAYLENNFRQLFVQHYNASSPEALTEPKVVFEKRLGNRLLFKLQCVEVGRGRPLRLVMNYIHDLSTGKWSFYSGTE